MENNTEIKAEAVLKPDSGAENENTQEKTIIRAGATNIKSASSGAGRNATNIKISETT